jgi:hypothetical protein
MASSALKCTNCLTALQSVMNGEPCPGCGDTLWVEVFPALFRAAAPPAEGSEPAVTEGEATCFYHPAKRAVLPCHSCGRFVCGLCDCELAGEHYCPVCLEIGKTKGRIRNLENRRTRYDSIALSLAVLPLVTVVFWFLTIVTAPVALFMAIRYWNAPLSIVQHSRLRFALAGVFALAEIGAWSIGMYVLFSNIYG